MEKDFKEWHRIKERVHASGSTSVYFKERDIWWCYCGANIGLEQDGKGEYFLRPVLIVKKFSRRLCWVIPLSTKVSNGSFFFSVLSESNIIRIACIPQMKMIDVRRLNNKIDSVSALELEFIKEKIIGFLR